MKSFFSIFLAFVFLNTSLPAAENFAFADLSNAGGKKHTLKESDIKSSFGRWEKGIHDSFGIAFKIDHFLIFLRSTRDGWAWPTTGKIRFEGGKQKFKAIYALHNAAYGADDGALVATYRLHYSDGTSQDFPVRYNREICDWWHPGSLPNARSAFHIIADNGQHLGVFLFRIENIDQQKEVDSIEVISADSTCTARIIAITGIKESAPEQFIQQIRKKLADTTPQLPPEDYYPCTISWNTPPHAGTALDFSGLNHKPAGKFGFLKRQGEHFEFEKRPGIPVRFWGTNFAIHGAFPEKEHTPGIVANVAAQGCNIVRIHLYANRTNQLCNPDGTLNEVNLDKLFFLISELKKNGIYTYMDINDGMCYDRLLNRPNSIAPKEEEFAKAASFFNAELQKAVERLISLLILRKNPYTGLAMIDDPAVAMYECINEASMQNHWGNPIGPIIGTPYETEILNLWQEALKKENQPERPFPAMLCNDPFARRFAAGLDEAYFKRIITFMRNNGLKAPISGTNIGFGLGMIKAQQNAGAEFFGEHFYWTHPNFGVNPKTYTDGMAALAHPRLSPFGSSDVVRCGIAGYPSVIGEWNYCYPNAQRVDGFPLLAAYSAYQDYDALLFYGATGSEDDGWWSRFVDNPSIMIHSQHTDPSTWGLSRLGAMIFRRGDVQTARKVFTVKVNQAEIFQEPPTLAALAFLTQFGKLRLDLSGSQNNALAELAKDKNSFETAIRQKLIPPDKTVAVSDTRELIRDSGKVLFYVNTPRTQCVTGQLFRLNETRNLTDISLSTPVKYGTFAITSLSGKPLRTAKRLLCFAVGNSANTGQQLQEGKIIAPGTAPVLTEPFPAEVSLNSSLPAKVYALDTVTGKRLREIPSEYRNGKVFFKLPGDNGTIYFEIVK